MSCPRLFILPCTLFPFVSHAYLAKDDQLLLPPSQNKYSFSIQILSTKYILLDCNEIHLIKLISNTNIKYE
jgi:hypothetical protein